MNADRYARMIELLIAAPITIAQLSERLELGGKVVWEYLSALRLRRLVHVGEWVNVRTEERPQWVAAYAFGRSPHAVRPPKKSHRQVLRESRTRRKMRALDRAVAGVQR